MHNVYANLMVQFCYVTIYCIPR